SRGWQSHSLNFRVCVSRSRKLPPMVSPAWFEARRLCALYGSGKPPLERAAHQEQMRFKQRTHGRLTVGPYKARFVSLLPELSPQELSSCVAWKQVAAPLASHPTVLPW